MTGYDGQVRATLAALCLLTGCRQVLGIESSILIDAEVPGDAPGPDASSTCGTGDFDGDGVYDDCDFCPHIASSNADADSDGVGDLCDPDLSSSDKRALWLSFTSASDIAAWSVVNGTWSVANGTLHAIPNSVSPSTLDSPVAYPTEIYFATSMTIVQPGTADVSFCAAGQCCTIANDPGAKTILKVTNGSVVSSVTMPSALVAGEEVVLAGFAGPQQFTCRLTRTTTAANALTPVTTSVAGPIKFYAEAQVDYRYVFVVTASP